MYKLWSLFLALGLIAAPITLVGCADDVDRGDSISENIEEGADETGDAIDDAGDGLGDALDGGVDVDVN